MNFLLGLFVEMGLSSKGDSRPNADCIWLEPVGDHSTDPFVAQDVFQHDVVRTPAKSMCSCFDWNTDPFCPVHGE